MKKVDLEKVLHWLGFVFRCPVCQYRYNLGTTKVLSSSEPGAGENARIVVHSDCTRCQSSVVFNMEFRGPEVVSHAAVTDLSGDEASEVRTRAAISPDEVIRIHEALRGSNLDIRAAAANL